MWSTLTKDKTYLKSEILATKIKMTEICRVLLVTLLFCLFWLPSDDAEENESFGGTFSVKDYTLWLKKHKIQLFNYAVEVNETVVIWSPILPVPKGLHWSSLNMENELSASTNQKLGLAYSHYFDKFLKTYNKSWARVFAYDRLNRYLRIQQVNLGYADMYRLHVDENKKDTGRKKMSSKDQDFDVAITLMTYTSHECEVKGGPQSPKQGDMLVMSCSVVVNGLWNTSLVFRNTFDRNEIRGNVSKCNRQPSVGSRICSTVRVKAEADILAYTCELEFLPERREDPKNPMFQNSKWTTRFNKEVVCHLPKIYLETIPSDVSFLCNNLPCGDTVEVNDNITCLAHGYPQPDFDLRITKDNSAPMIHEEESEALKRMFEHVEAIERHIDDGGIVKKRALKNIVHSLLNSMINESIQLKMDRGEDGALGEGEEVDTTMGTIYQRNFSEMIDVISKHVQAIGRRFDGNSTITMQDLKEALSELEGEIRTVVDKVHEKLNGSLPDIESNEYKKLEIVIGRLLNITEAILRSILAEVPEENSLTSDEESDEDLEPLIDEVNELIFEFMDAYNLDEEKVKELYDSIVQNYEFPGLEYKGHVFLDSEELPDSDDNASTVETASPVTTEDLTEDTQSMPETDNLSTTEAIPASTDESAAGSGEDGIDTDSDSAEEEGDAVISDNTTQAVNDGEGITEILDYSLNDIETDEPPLATDLSQLTDEGIGEPEMTTEWISDAPDFGEAKTEPEPEDREEDGEERGDKEDENDTDKEGIVEENEQEKIEEDGTTEETVTIAASEREEDGEVTSGTAESVEKTFKGFEEYQVQVKDIGHIEVSCNVSNALGWGYNSILLQVSSPTQKPVSSTINPPQPDKDQTMSPIMTDKEPDEPDKEPDEPDKEPGEPHKEPDEPDKEPDEADKEPDEPDKKPEEQDKESDEPDKEPDTPDKEPDEPDKEPDESDKEPGEPDKEPGEHDKEPGEPAKDLDKHDKEPDEPDKEPDEPDKEPDEPDEEPVEPDKESDEPDKEPDEPDKQPLEYTREVTAGSQFSQMPETEKMEHSGVKNEYETSTRYYVLENTGAQETFESKEDTHGRSLITDSGSIDEDVKTTPEDTTEVDAGAAAGDLVAEENRVESGNPAGGEADKSDGQITKPSSQDLNTVSLCTAGRNVQSIVLELFLLIFGVCLTRIEL